MVAINGEVLTISRRLRHSASLLFLDGEPIDAGTAMHLDSNLSHQLGESVRHLGTCLLPASAAYQGAGYNQLLDRADPGAAAAVGPSNISWAHRVSRVLGPFDILADRDLGDSRRALRNVRVKVRAHAATASSLTLYAALTVGVLPPGGDGLQPLVWAREVASSGLATTTLELAVDDAVAHGETQLCRGGTTPRYAPTAGIYVWVGWQSTDALDRLISLSAFETR